ncbi:MAG: PQQ-binding-like beta-propeller repeat protein [Chthoniobacterales bacterium]|nr:PQQ-binding-like beta-propeller repeat protein [Chthoniobacterales bacterium]
MNFRVTRAQFAAATSNAGDELRLYQEILLEPQWRAIQLTSRDDGSVASAGVVSERAIARILSTPAGPDAFAVFQQAASDELKEAAGGNNPDALLAVAQRYPNTDAAPAAMLAAAEQFEAQGKFRSATQVLNQTDRRYRDRADRTKLIETQVRNYLRLPNGLAVAIKHLATGSKLSSESQFEQPITLPDGSTIDAGTTFAAALETLRQKSATIAARNLPNLGIPVPSKEGREPFVPENERTVLNDIDLLLVPAREFARHDRIVAFSTGRGVQVFAPGATAPLSTAAALGEPATSCAWVGDADRNLLVWGNSSVALLTPDGSDAKWRVQLAAMTELQVVAATEGVVVDRAVGEVDTGTEVRIQANQPIRFGRGRRRGMQVVPDVNQNLPVANRNGETLVHVCPLGDRVVLSTSTGRVMAIEYASGDVAWQTRLSVTAIHQMIAADDFAVLRLIDDFGVQLIAVETFAGQVTHRRIFSQDAVPVNMTLAPDGTLVYTMNNRLCGKNLYDPNADLDFEYPTGTEGGPAYFGATMPDQLVVADDRIIAVSDNGVLVRVHSLETGKELLKAFTTGSSNWNVRVRVVGPNLYVITQTGVTGYNFDQPERVWHSRIPPKQTPNIQDVFVGNMYLLLLDKGTPRGADQMRDLRGAIQPPNAANGNLGAPRFQLWAFGRYPAKENETIESGRLDYAVQVTHPVGISQWQPVEGGLYYRTADRKLHFLRGSDAKLN